MKKGCWGDSRWCAFRKEMALSVSAREFGPAHFPRRDVGGRQRNLEGPLRVTVTGGGQGAIRSADNVVRQAALPGTRQELGGGGVSLQDESLHPLEHFPQARAPDARQGDEARDGFEAGPGRVDGGSRVHS